MRIVLDTNVLVSGLLSPHGPPGRIVDLITSLLVTVLYDDRILAEYRAVLARPKLRMDPTEVAIVLSLIERYGQLVVAPPLALDLPDPDDLPFLEVALAGGADALVTGHRRHFLAAGDAEGPPGLIDPAGFVRNWTQPR